MSMVYFLCIKPTRRIPIGAATTMYLLFGASVAQFQPHHYLNFEDVLNGAGAVLGITWVIIALW